uniref:lamin tail domain-containing protein n=1 Tax=Flavobacterium sp. UBA7682 TaxID=1946560 RepID=UPI0025C06A55
MKMITFSKNILFIALILFSIHGLSQNLLTNGDFQLGVNVGYQGGQNPNYSYISAPFSGTTTAGNWAIVTNSQPVNTASFLSVGDHSPGSGNMMVVDGTGSGGQPRFWSAGTNGSGVCGLTVGATYTFSYWIRSIFTTVGTLSNIGVQFNNASNVTLVSGSAIAPTIVNGWQQVVYTFTATNACVNIEMYNNNTDFAGNDFAIDDLSLTILSTCPVPTVSITQQPTCVINTGTIVFTSPLNTSPLPIPTDLFISEVTDHEPGSLTYIEIFNGTGSPKNLSNYKIKVYNNGNAFISANCDIQLSGTLNNNAVYVIAVGTATNQGGVVPNLVVANCGGVNTDDTIRLATSADVEFDLWGTNGINFTPVNQPGYTYRRNTTAPHPTMTWNPADWTALDPQDYTNVGTYTYQAINYEYSVNGTTYQSSPIFTGLAPGTYNATVRDLVTGCVSTQIPLVVDPVQVNPTSPSNIFCDGANTTATQVGFDFNSIGQNSFDFTYTVDGGPAISGTIPFSPSSYFVTGVTQGQAVTLTIAWNGVCTPPRTLTCYPDCVTPVTPTFNQIAPICSGEVLAPLPTTSLNGVVGTWSPLLNNTATTTYTFTPLNAGECGTTTTMTIVVNAPVLAITNPAAVCSPATINLTLPAVTAGSTGGGTLTYWTDALATTPLATPTAVATSGTYYIKSTAGSCFDIEPVTITISAAPVLTITNPVAVCAPGTVDLTLPAITAGSTGGGILTYWTNAAATNLLATPTAVATSGTYYIKSTVGSCSDIEAVTVTINSSPVLTITNPASVCAPASVDLTLPAVTAGSTGSGILSYWTNATATTPLATPNAITTGGTYYIRSAVGSCSDIEPVTVTINPSPILTITNPASVCASATVDITLPAVTAGSTGGGTLSYWIDVAATNPLVTPNAVTTSGTYYIQSAVGSCSDIKPVTVIIDSSPVLNITNPSAVCAPASIDLTLPAVTAGSTGSGTLTYWTNAAGTIPLATPTAVTTGGTYYIRSTVSSCSDIEPVIVTINPSPVLTITNPIAVCAPATVNLTLPAVTAGSTGGGTLTYWTNAAGTIALASPNTVATSGTYYIKSTVGACSDIEPVTVVISSTIIPTFNITSSTVCQGSVITPLPVTSLNGISGTWSPALNNTATTTYTFNPTPSAAIPCPIPTTFQIQVIPQIDPVVSIVESCNSNSVTVTSPVGVNYEYSLDGGVYQSNPFFNNLTAGGHSIVAHQIAANCFSNATGFNINSVVNDIIVNNPQPLHYCDPSNDGFVLFNLSQVINSITGGNPYTVTFHETITDANVDGTSIPDIFNYENINPWVQTIFIRVESTTTSCFEVVHLQLIVDPTPEATEPDDYELCDYTGQIGYEAFDLTTTEPQIL